MDLRLGLGWDLSSIVEGEWGAESGVETEHCLGCYPVDSWCHRRRRVGGASWWTRRKIDGGGAKTFLLQSPVSSTKPIMEFLFINVVVNQPITLTRFCFPCVSLSNQFSYS